MPKRQSLLEKAFDEAPRAKAPKSSTSISIDKQVCKAISDNFKQFTDAEIDATVVDNLTLRQHIAKDKLPTRPKQAASSWGHATTGSCARNTQAPVIH